MFYGKVPNAREMQRLPGVVKIQLFKTRWVRETTEDSEAFVKDWVEKVSGAEVLDVHYGISKRPETEGEHSGYCFIQVRKSQVAQVIAMCDRHPCEEMDQTSPEEVEKYGPCVIRAQVSRAHYVELGWEQTRPVLRRQTQKA